MNLRIYLVVSTAISLLAIFTYGFFFSAKTTVIYVNNELVFEKFKMSIDIKKKGEAEIKSRSYAVDSLYRLIQTASNDDVKEFYMKDFVRKKEDLQQFSSEFATVESKKIWQRIKGYAKSYSDENGYDVVLGLNPDNNVINGNEQLDKTDDFINYLNKKYEGEN